MLTIKVREATSNDAWGPSSSLMSDIADMTYNNQAFNEIMEMVCLVLYYIYLYYLSLLMI